MRRRLVVADTDIDGTVRRDDAREGTRLNTPRRSVVVVSDRIKRHGEADNHFRRSSRASWRCECVDLPTQREGGAVHNLSWRACRAALAERVRLVVTPDD